MGEPALCAAVEDLATKTRAGLDAIAESGDALGEIADRLPAPEFHPSTT